MSFLDPNDPPETQIVKQGKIIDALVRRASRQSEVGLSAYNAFQSAIELQAQLAAQSRDLERTATELESARYEREHTRRNLAEALSSMEEGFALFTDRELDLCNELFRSLLPDIADRIVPGLDLERYFQLMSGSAFLVSTDRDVQQTMSQMWSGHSQASVASLVVELVNDRWYQISLQHTSPDNMVLLLTEFTEIVRQNRTEKKHLIDRQADYLQAVFENMTSGVCTFSAEGEVMMYNGQFRQLLGLPFTVLQKGVTLQRLLEFMKARSLITDESLLKVQSWRQQLTRDGGFHKRVRQGEGRMIEVQANVLPDGGYLVELKDVTLESRATETLENRVMERTAELTRANLRLTEQYEEKARVEEELRLAKERAEAAVSSKTRFLAAASHDLLQPINAAKLLISTLKETAQERQFAPTVDRLYGAFTSTEQLLHSLLDISRLDSNDPDAVSPATVSLGALIQSVIADQTPLAEQKNVQLDVVPSSAFVHSDPVYLLRSIQNLVVNAIQYTEPGGRVLVGCRRSGAKSVLQVWDTGIGIRRKDQQRIFEEFARADNVPLGSGMGLGLSVVDRACRHLGHRLWVRSKPGVGSVFSIEMDRVAVPTTVVEPGVLEHAASDLPLDHIVMVVENDADVLFATTQRLEHWGASVMAASSTQEALTFVRDMGIPPDIILADYQLDNGDTGIDAIRKIRALTGCKVPAIMITADRRESLRRAGAEHDFTVMTKPVKLARLRPLIEWKIRWQTSEAATRTDQAVQTKVDNDTGA